MEMSQLFKYSSTELFESQKKKALVSTPAIWSKLFYLYLLIMPCSCTNIMNLLLNIHTIWIIIIIYQQGI